MKKSIILALYIGAFLISCQEDSVKPAEEFNQELTASATFQFTDAEVNELITGKFGNQQLTFEQKGKFLNSSILSVVASASKKTSHRKRTSGEVKVACVAGTWIHGVWTFNTDNGFTNEVVYASRKEQPEQATAVGTSASIWIDYNDNGAFGDGTDYYDNDYTAPIQPSCGGDQVKGVAVSMRGTADSGNITLYTYVDCDD